MKKKKLEEYAKECERLKEQRKTKLEISIFDLLEIVYMAEGFLSLRESIIVELQNGEKENASN